MADTSLCSDDELSNEDGSMKCAECGYNYHFGSFSGVSESTFKSKSEIWREKEVNVQQMTQDINALEWQTRTMNLEIHGIPVSERENLNNKINQVTEKLGVPVLTDSEIVALHRLPARPDKVPGIIVRFAKQSTRDQWLEKRKSWTERGGMSASLKI